jgi:putative transposase
LCRKLGIAEQTFYRWKSKYGGMLPSNRKQIRQIEEENAKRKKLVANQSLDRGCRRTHWQKGFESLPRRN